MNKILLISIFCLGLILISGCVSQSSYAELKSENEMLTKKISSNDEFMKSYAIALNNIHMAIMYQRLATINLDKAYEYVMGDEGYIYQYAELLFEEGREQSLHAKELLNKADAKLRSISGQSPNQFFKTEVNNRIKQVIILSKINNLTYEVLDHTQKIVYEINYGNENSLQNLDDNFDTYASDKYDKLLSDLSEVENKIDLAWDQDWYEMYQGSTD